MADRSTAWCNLRQLIQPMDALLPLALACAVLCASTAPEACDTPVFQQALEAWEPDRFQAQVVHRGPLSSQEAALVEALRAGTRATAAPVNLDISTVELDRSPPEVRRQLVGENEALPRLILRYPFSAFGGHPLWSGPLTVALVRGLLDSPVRRTLARRLMGSDAIVFVLLETGTASVDRAVAGRLTQLLGEMEAASKQLIQVEGLEPTFSLLRLPRSDPAEQVLVRTLLRSEPDLEGYTDQPIAFPVFGRGRVLCALVGPGINAETVEEVCAFLVGPCSCLVKADNPGFDLVMRADWKRVPGVQAPTEGEPLPLVSLPDGSVLDSTFARVADMEGASRSGLAEGDRGGPLVAGALMALAAIAVAVALGTFMLRRAGGRRKPNAGP